MLKQKQNDSLNVGRILKEFQKGERTKSHSRGMFKIEGKFEDAVRKIVKTKPKAKVR